MQFIFFFFRLLARVLNILFVRRREAAWASERMAGLEASLGGQLTEQARKKIITSYSIYQPMIVAAFTGLRERRVSDGERERMLLYFICSTLFDDFTDRGELSEEELYDISYRPLTYLAQRPEEKFFLHAHLQLKRYVGENDAYDAATRKLFRAQADSARQLDPAIGDDELYRITIEKGSYAVLLSSFYLDGHISAEERACWFRLGGIIQMTNDLFDIWNDLQEGVQTLPVRMTDADAFHEFFLGMVTGMESELVGITAAPSRKKVLWRDMLAICSFGDMAILQLKAVQCQNGQLPPLHTLSRKVLIVDMEKFANIWHCIRFVWKRYPAMTVLQKKVQV